MKDTGNTESSIINGAASQHSSCNRALSNLMTCPSIQARISTLHDTLPHASRPPLSLSMSRSLFLFLSAYHCLCLCPHPLSLSRPSEHMTALSSTKRHHKSLYLPINHAHARTRNHLPGPLPVPVCLSLTVSLPITACVSLTARTTVISTSSFLALRSRNCFSFW